MRKKEQTSNYAGGFLADSPGLGKTLQTLACIVNGRRGRDKRPTLIVVPVSVRDQWIDQIEEHCELDVSKASKTYDNIKKEEKAEILGAINSGSKRINPLKSDDLKKYMIIVATHHEVLYDKGILASVDWLRVVVDEGNILRNKSGKIHKALTTLSASHKWILTGTPFTNTISEIYSYLVFLNAPGLETPRKFSKVYNTHCQAGLDNLDELIKDLMIKRMHSHTMFGRPLFELPKSYESTVLVC
jgi:SWI/SNF-related matrix-associated actin-dependent regulator of chromatin subfamily A3